MVKFLDMYDWPTQPPCWLQKLTKPIQLTCIQDRRAQHGSSLRQVGRLRRSCTSSDNHALHHDLYLQESRKVTASKADERKSKLKQDSNFFAALRANDHKPPVTYISVKKANVPADRGFPGS